MKKFFTMMIMVLAVAMAMAQAPEKFSYQAVVRNASNALVTNAQVGVRVSILQGSASGNAVYVETHTANTNTNGLLTIEIGGGTVQQGVFANIDWANGPYFLKTETDPNGGSSYSITSVQQLLSVPYALYAKDAGNVPTVPVNVSAFTNDAGYITAQDIPEIPTVPTNVSAFVNDVPYMTSFTEQQILTISNDTIFLTGGSFVKLPEGFNGDYNSLTNTPAIPTVPTNVSAFVNDMGYLTSFTEQQVLSISNDTIFLTGGSFVKLPAGFDGDYNNLTNTPDIPTVPADVSVFNNDANYVSNTECADVDLCALATALAQLQALVEEQQQRIEDLEAQMGSDTTTIDTTTVTNGIPCPGTPTVTDYDGNVYNTVLIGTQCWTKENLRTTHYADGTAIPAGGSDTSYTEPYYYDYSTHSLPLETRGYLYNWPAAMHGASSSNANPSGVQGICPAGWHLPRDAEWTQLTDYVKTQSDYVCGGNTSYNAKALASTEGWNTNSYTCAVGNNPSANNATGFSAVPAGFCCGSSFYHAGDGATFWSSTECGSSTAYYCRLGYINAHVYGGFDYGRGNGFSVRCLRNEDGTDTTQTTLPTIITGAVSDITETTATCGGEVTADGGATVTARGVCWSTSATPTVADNYTSDGAGLGTFTSNITGLTANTTYYVRAYAINSVGTAYGETETFTTEASTPVVHGQPCPGVPTVTDIDGNIYNTVQIGQQCWMRENMRTTHYADGTAIPAGGSNYSYTEPYYYDYSTHSLPLAQRGYLYNWPAAMHGASSSSANPSGVQGVCPTGWHLPSDAEWTQLTDYVSSQPEYTCGGNPGSIAKALASETGWNTNSYTCAVGNDPSANNASGFSVVPAGTWFYGFNDAGDGACFWSSTEGGTGYAWYRYLNYSYASVIRYSDGYRFNGYSVRCLRDEGGTDTTQATLPTVITGAVSGITETTAICGGNVTSDGGATVTARGVCWSTSVTPTIADNHTSDGLGIGTFTSSITGLTANTTYYVRAYAINSVGTAYGEMVTFTTEASTPVVHGQPCPGTPTVTDYDGNIYNTVQIGTQCWTKENLRTTHYADGTAIPAGGSNTSYTEPYYYDYSTHSLPLETRGYLYNWSAAMHGAASSNANPSGVQGICPAGWHLPSDAEWTQLTNYVGSQSEYTCGGNSSYIAKALASETGWNSHTNACAVGNDPSANNASGFSAVPAGDGDGSYFDYAGSGANFWSSTEYSSDIVWNRFLDFGNADVGRYENYKFGETSVRCLRDEDGTDTTQSTLPTVITSAVSDITETTATCGGEVIADGGAAVTEHGVCWSTSATPTVADNHTSDGAGLGTFTSSIANLTASTTYYVRAYATNSVGTAYGETVTFTTEATTPVVDGQPCPGTPTVTDHEGNVYATVQIGNQCWMRDNLRTTTSPSTGTYLIPTAGTGYTYTGKQARWYDNDSATYAPMNYGLLYNWNAAVDTFNTAYGETSVNTSSNQAVSVSFTGYRQGICPAGWHLPSNAEWTQLFGQIDYICYGTGFSAIPAGRYLGSSFNSAGYFATFWTSTQGDSGNAYRLLLNCNNARLIRNDGSKGDGFSVRCLRD